MMQGELGPPIGLEEMIEEIEAETIDDAKVLVKAGALHMEGAVKEKLSGSRSGRVYRVPLTQSAVHVASAPGEPPAVLFGHLRNSIGHTEPEVRGNMVNSDIGPGLGTGARAADAADEDPRGYARIMELGGLAGRGHSVRILARPYMRPSFLEQEPVVVGMWERGL